MNVPSMSEAPPQSSSSLLKSIPLEVVSLAKRFGQVKAVDGISLELRGGECLGLLGPNGAGKSTLIRGIVGRVIPDAGRVSVFGFPANTSEARSALGWVPQELALYPRLTCRENLAAFGRYHGLSGKKLAESVLKKDPSQPVAATVIGALLIRDDKFDAASKVLTPALDREHPDKHVLELLMRSHLKQNEPDRVFELCELGRKHFPYSSDWWKGIAA